MSYLSQLQKAVEQENGCSAVHQGTTSVVEQSEGRVIFDGEVETFALSGHPKATQCYAWAYGEAGKLHVTSVLKLPPVDSPETAVKAAIVARARQVAAQRPGKS